MNTLGTKDQQIARLEGLLKRIQVNAAALRGERGHGLEAIAGPPSLTPSSDRPISGGPTTTPTGTIPPRSVLGTLPDFLDQPGAALAAADTAFGAPEALAALDANEPVTQIPAPPPVEVAIGITEVPLETELSLDSIDSDLPTLPPSRDDDFQDPVTEHTKPLWLGLNEGTGTFKGETTDGSRIGDAHRTLAETPAAKVYDTSIGYATYGEVAQENGDAAASTEGTEVALQELEVVEDGVDQVGVDIAAFDNGLGEEEHLDTSPPISGHRASSRGSELSVVADAFADGSEDLEQELEMSPTQVDDSGARISDAPPSVIGATITLPEESSAVSLELLDPPSSSLRSSQPKPDDELEAELPRNSFRAEYDASLSAPPTAFDDLRARDRADQERKDLERRASRSPAHVEIGNVPDDDLPPVLSMRPSSPGGSVRSVVYAPEPEAVSAVFEGSRPPLRSFAFLELLDASLAIAPRQ